MVGTIVRFVVSALVLMFVSWLVPGFRVYGFGGALIAAIAIALIGYLVESVIGRGVSPRTRGIVGFLTSAAVIYLTGLLLPGTLSVSLFGALAAAFVIGLIDTVVPTELR
jgi:putative membrane protein